MIRLIWRERFTKTMIDENKGEEISEGTS